MRIAFGDFSPLDFHAQTAEAQPLGGSHSAACYLTQALARRGHEVSLFTHTKAPGIYAGVACHAWQTTPVEALRARRPEVFVRLLSAEDSAGLREVIGPEIPFVLWTQHAANESAVHSLAQAPERDCYAGFAFVSDWQRADYLARFALPAERARVLRNAPAPVFANLLAEGEAILPAKIRPPVIAYTSTPFRGLDVLLDAFPKIRAQVPDVRLRVYSSMEVYQTAPVVDHLQYGDLYARCRSTPGVEYIGSLPQSALAAEMRRVTTLAYPNTFPETSCIAAIEAMASGCRVVTSRLAALPETTAGFAELIEPDQSREDYIADFSERVVATLREAEAAAPATEDRLQRQVRYIHREITWDHRAAQWEEWLRELVGIGT